MKKIVIFIAGLLLFSPGSSSALFLAEQAFTLPKNQVILREGLLFTNFPRISNPGLFEENPVQILSGMTLERDIWEIPLEIKVGLADGFTFSLGGSYLYNTHRYNPGTYNLSSNGFSCVEVKGLKSIIKSEDGIPALSLLFGVSFPLGDDDLLAEDGALKLKLPLGDRGVTLGLTEVVSKDFGLVALHINLGYELRLPFVQRVDSRGITLSAARILDPGDRFVYNLAIERKWPGFSFVIEIDGRAMRDNRMNNVDIPGSGTHIVQMLGGFQFNPSSGFSIEAGIRSSVLSAGGNKDYFYGPVFGLIEKF